jgi:hypothetical protein
MTSEIEIKLTRDSVCMGDDVEDHTKIIRVVAAMTTAETILRVAEKYLANVAGSGHSWSCILNGTECAVIKGNCANITSIADVSFLEVNNLHFKYNSAAY